MYVYDIYKIKSWTDVNHSSLIRVLLQIKDNIFAGCRTVTPAVTQKGHTFQYGDLQQKISITPLFAEEWTHSTHLEERRIGKQCGEWITKNHYKSELKIFGQTEIMIVFSQNDDGHFYEGKNGKMQSYVNSDNSVKWLSYSVMWHLIKGL